MRVVAASSARRDRKDKKVSYTLLSLASEVEAKRLERLNTLFLFNLINYQYSFFFYIKDIVEHITK